MTLTEELARTSTGFVFWHDAKTSATTNSTTRIIVAPDVMKSGETDSNHLLGERDRLAINPDRAAVAAFSAPLLFGHELGKEVIEAITKPVDRCGNFLKSVPADVLSGDM